MSSRATSLLATVLLLALGSRAVGAQTLTVSSATGGSLTINSATAGNDPTGTNAGASATTYRVRTPNSGAKMRISARLTTAMPPNTTLTLTMAAPTGATATPVVLTTVNQDVITNIPLNTNQNLLSISYRLDATASAGVIALTSRMITLTLQ